MARITVLEVIAALESSRKTIRCEELRAFLIQLGFEIRDGKQGGHKVFFHGGLANFKSGSYNCGHGKNPEIKPAYVREVICILEQYEQELTEFQGGLNND